MMLLLSDNVNAVIRNQQGKRSFKQTKKLAAFKILIDTALIYKFCRLLSQYSEKFLFS